MTSEGSPTDDFSFSFGVKPVAVDDPYIASGNIGIAVNVANGVLSNDEGSGLSVDQVEGSGANVGVATTTGNGGTITLNATGDFTYEPPPGFEGGDTFTYRVSGASGTSNTATVTVTIADMGWFIDNAASGSNTGTFSNPFQTIAAFNAANALSGAVPDPKDGDFIALRTGTYSETDGINLRNNQVLIGEAVQFDLFFTAASNSLTAYQTFAAGTGTAPTITTTSGSDNGVDLSSGNSVRGLNVGNTPGGAGVSGTGVGTLTVRDVAISGTGTTVDLDTGVLDVTFTSLQSTGTTGSDPGFSLNALSGSFQVTGTTSLTGINGPGYRALGAATLSLTHDGSLSVVNIGSSGEDGVSIDLDGSSTVSFNGGLDVTTSGANGLVVSTTGTVNIGTTTNTISATTGAAILADNTNIGSGWTFSSVASTSSPSDGAKFDTIVGNITLSSINIDAPTNDGLEFNTITGDVSVTAH